MNNYTETKQKTLIVSTYLPAYLKIKGKNISSRNTYHCLNPDHDDTHPSMHLFNGRDGKLRLKCQSCGEVLDLYNVVGRLDHIHGFRAQYLHICKIFNLDPNAPLPHPDYTSYPRKLPQETIRTYINWASTSPLRIDKWKARGIESPLVEEYKLGFDNVKGAYVIPIRENGYIQRFIGNCTPKYKKSQGLDTFFISNTLNNNLPLIITEGEIDALSILQIRYPNVVSLGGVANLKSIYSKISNSFRLPIVLALDIDKSGQTALSELIKLCHKEDLKLPYNFWDYFKPNSLYNYKDINDLLLRDQIALRNALDRIYNREDMQNEKSN